MCYIYALNFLKIYFISYMCWTLKTQSDPNESSLETILAMFILHPHSTITCPLGPLASVSREQVTQVPVAQGWDTAEAVAWFSSANDQLSHAPITASLQMMDLGMCPLYDNKQESAKKPVCVGVISITFHYFFPNPGQLLLGVSMPGRQETQCW